MRPHAGLGAATFFGGLLMLGLAWYIAGNSVAGFVATSSLPSGWSTLALWVCVALALIATLVGLLAILYRFLRPTDEPADFSLPGEDWDPAPSRRNVAVLGVVAGLIFLPIGLAAVHVVPVEGHFAWSQATPADSSCWMNWPYRVWPSYSFPSGSSVQLHWWTSDGRPAAVYLQTEGTPLPHVFYRLPTDTGGQSSTGAAEFLAPPSPVTFAACPAILSFAPGSTPVAPVEVNLAGAYYSNATPSLL